MDRKEKKGTDRKKQDEDENSMMLKLEKEIKSKLKYSYKNEEEEEEKSEGSEENKEEEPKLAAIKLFMIVSDIFSSIPTKMPFRTLNSATRKNAQGGNWKD